MRTEPTEQQNRAAIDAIKAEERFPEGVTLKDARSGYVNTEDVYGVYASVNGNDMPIAAFDALKLPKGVARFLAEKLTRDINSGVYNG